MFLGELARRIWYFVRRDRLSDELADEMRLHLELRAQRERQADAFARLRAAVQRVDPSQVLYDLKTMEQVAAESVTEQRATSVARDLGHSHATRGIGQFVVIMAL